MKESNFCKKSPFTTDTSSSSSSSNRSELQLGHDNTTHRPKRLQPRLLQSLGHPEVNNNIIEAVADNYELLPSSKKIFIFTIWLLFTFFKNKNRN